MAWRVSRMRAQPAEPDENMLKGFFRSPSGIWLNIAALAYTLLGWVGGIALLTADAWYANLVGVLLTGKGPVGTCCHVSFVFVS